MYSNPHHHYFWPGTQSTDDFSAMALLPQNLGITLQTPTIWKCHKMQISSRSFLETVWLFNLLRTILEFCVGKGKGRSSAYKVFSIIPWSWKMYWLTPQSSCIGDLALESRPVIWSSILEGWGKWELAYYEVIIMEGKGEWHVEDSSEFLIT